MDKEIVAGILAEKNEELQVLNNVEPQNLKGIVRTIEPTHCEKH